eukprot:superscaffoldBa00000286_g3503
MDPSDRNPLELTEMFQMSSVMFTFLLTAVFGVITEFEAAKLQELLDYYEFMIAFGNGTCLFNMPEEQQLGSQLCAGFGQRQQIYKATQMHLYQILFSAGGATVCGQHYLQHFTPGLSEQRRSPDCVISTSVVFYLLTGLLPSLLPATCAVR